ncbi:RDD family protein [Brevibacterium yomogidense]|uniref:RDD family protein n=1 Tax=Brevibacterium yomogidense TaxID=946573 RepID=UPI0018DF8FCD|nr:RDD family protein [Brevibacterium yomogidense]
MGAEGNGGPHRSEWLTGPSLPDGSWQGERLGLPQSGPGAVGSMLRRVAGIALDWAIALVIANLILDADVLVMNIAIHVVFAVLYFLSVWLLGRTPGHLVMGLGVVDVVTRGTLASTGPVGVLRALVRTVLVCLVIPVVITDPDGRGLHDKATSTVVVRTR